MRIGNKWQEIGFLKSVLPSKYAFSIVHFVIPFSKVTKAHSQLFTSGVVKSPSASYTATP